jgi:hypothetical protein
MVVAIGSDEFTVPISNRYTIEPVDPDRAAFFTVKIGHPIEMTSFTGLKSTGSLMTIGGEGTDGVGTGALDG